MKTRLLCLLLFLSHQIYAQTGGKQERYNEKVFSAGFSEADKALWPQKIQPDYSYGLENGKFQLRCADNTKKLYTGLKWQNTLTAYRVHTALILESKANDGDVGFAYDVHGKLESGYIFEINPKRYRVLRIEGPGVFKPMTAKGENDGWVDLKFPIGAGKPFSLEIVRGATTTTVQLNEALVFTYKNSPTIAAGNFGFYYEGSLIVSVSELSVYGLSPSQPLAKDSVPLVQKAKELIKETAKLKEEKPLKVADKPKEEKPKAEAVKPKEEKTLKLAEMEKVESPAKPAEKPKPEKPHKEEPAKPKEEKKENPAKTTAKEKPAETVKEVRKEVVIRELPDTASPAKKREVPEPIEEPAKEPEPEKPATPDPAASADILTLSTAIADTRKKNAELQDKIETCELELGQVKSKKKELEDFIKENLDVKLKAQLEELQAKTDKLEAENASLKEENTGLKQFKEDVKNSKDGDVIVVLSDNLEKERRQNAELTKKLKELEKKLKVKN